MQCWNLVRESYSYNLESRIWKNKKITCFKKNFFL